MYIKVLPLLLLSVSALAEPEPEPQLEKKNNPFAAAVNKGVSENPYLQSLMAEESSLYPIAFSTSYANPASFSSFTPFTEPPTPTQGGFGGFGGFSIPASIESVLITAVPTAFISAMANPTESASIVSEIQHGHIPQWYQNLPPSVTAWLASNLPGFSALNHEANAAIAPSGLGPALIAGAASILLLALYL